MIRRTLALGGLLTGAALGGYAAVRLGTYLERRLADDEQADLDAAARSITGHRTPRRAQTAANPRGEAAPNASSNN
jgi:hypothetical protein